MADTQELGIAALSEHALNLTIVHGPWSVGGWLELEVASSVLCRPKGFKVIAAPIPLTSLSDDVKALDRVYGSYEWTCCSCFACVWPVRRYPGDANVPCDGLWCISAGLNSREGETVAEVILSWRSRMRWRATGLPDASGIIWMPAEGIRIGLRAQSFSGADCVVERHATTDCGRGYPGTIAEPALDRQNPPGT
jgi:hypothetical protein